VETAGTGNGTQWFVDGKAAKERGSGFLNDQIFNNGYFFNNFRQRRVEK